MIRPKQVLVINVSRIGDTLLATPAIRALAAAWPEASVDVLGHANRIEVLKHLPFVRRVGSISKKTAYFRGWFDLLAKPYDLAVVYGFDSSLVAYALRVARHVTAFRQRSHKLNHQIGTLVEPPLLQSDHSVRLALALPEALGVAPVGLRLSYVVSDAERIHADAILARDIPKNASPLVGVQVASFPTKAYRDWPITSFIEICERISQQWPAAHFLIFGGKEERQRTEMLKAALGVTATHYAGRLSLRQTAALMSRLDLYVGVDTGPTHMMSTFDIPIVGLYHGISRSQLIGPLQHPAAFPVDHPDAGPGCTSTASMADITVEQVWFAVQQALACRSHT